jgi:hypothetical protein
VQISTAVKLRTKNNGLGSGNDLDVVSETKIRLFFYVKLYAYIVRTLQ